MQLQMGEPRKGSLEGTFEYRPEGRERAGQKIPVKMHQGRRARAEVLRYNLPGIFEKQQGN